MKKVAVVAAGPEDQIPSLDNYKQEIDRWIGADRGALTIIRSGIHLDIAIGDFDSLSTAEKEEVKNNSDLFLSFPVEKDETDLELALLQAIELFPKQLFLFGVTGGRLDHQMASVQLLYTLRKKSIKATIVDRNNSIELFFSGEHRVEKDKKYPYISFIPFSKEVIGISLEGFYYKLSNKNIYWGSTRCISNQLNAETGTFSFKEGILLVIKSRDVLI
ncbi:thiamine diphosphokinase [Aquibacillus kalidii]|uniref:thiamine diphosphokinase n=1 Tax=Aquibacillus kalidii TaxID=2762597 RepID=UPI001646ED2F|nr:thiamine diphosphokinase [Aquibacillus kalidii]